MSRFVADVPSTVGALAPFVEAGVFGPSEVQLAETVSRLRLAEAGSLSAEEALALAVAARAPRLGHVCVELDEVASRIVERDHDDELPWPEPRAWAAALDASDLVRRPGEPPGGPVRPLVWDGTRLYLHRYEAYEDGVAADLARRSATSLPPITAGDLSGLFTAPDDGPDRQRRAAEVALANPVSVIAGGPAPARPTPSPACSPPRSPRRTPRSGSSRSPPPPARPRPA